MAAKTETETRTAIARATELFDSADELLTNYRLGGAKDADLLARSERVWAIAHRFLADNGLRRETVLVAPGRYSVAVVKGL